MIVLTVRALKRFFASVELDAERGCWLWKGNLTKGYGRIQVSRRILKAHRFTYQALVRRLSPSEVLDHKCRTRHCVNPLHLEPITNRQNTLRGLASRKAAGTLPLFQELAS